LVLFLRKNIKNIDRMVSGNIKTPMNVKLNKIKKIISVYLISKKKTRNIAEKK
jgi:hypothetical protein